MPITIDGLVSGLDTTGIINDILSLERRPIQLITNQVELARSRQTAFLDLSARLLNLQVSAGRLANPSTFKAVSVSSTRPETLVASAGPGVPPGTYSFRVAQLARGSQFVSRGFATADASPVGAGTLSLELGGGFVDGATELDALNGGLGVARGSIRVTDGAGNTAVVDLSTAITVDDVIAAINDATGVDVVAQVAGTGTTNVGRALVLVDQSGGPGSLQVEEIGTGQTAADLGILGSAVGTLAGSAIRTLGVDSLLSGLGDGLGLRGSGSAAADLLFTLTDGSTAGVDVDSLSTVQDLIDAVTTATGGNLTLSVNATGDGFDLLDASGGGGSLVVANATVGSAASDLGLAGTHGGGTANGTRVLAGLNDVLLATLRGGSGVASGSILVQNRAGASTAIDLSAAETLQDVIRAINAAGAGVTASTTPNGNGLLLRDTSGGNGALQVSEAGSTTAADLGLLVGPVTTTTLQGTDLDPRYIHENTRLSSLNGGRGVAGGSVRIVDSAGIAFTVDLSQEDTIGEIIRDIQGAASVVGSAVTVGINADGNGLLITSSAGAGTLRIEEVAGGRTARDLNILGSAEAGTPNVIDGAFEKSITIGADDTLDDVRAAIADLGLDVAVSVVNDGSGQNPFRLSLVSNQTGAGSRLLVDVVGSNLSFQETARAQDGVVFYGESGAGTQPVLLRSRSNSYSNVVEGLTITAQEVDASPVRVTIQRDSEAVVDEVEELLARFNDVLSVINDLTAFDLEANTQGLLVGDGTLRGLKDNLLRSLTRPLAETGNRYSLAAQLGLRVTGDRVTLDRTEFAAALAADPAAVERFFTAPRTLTGTTPLADFNNGQGVDTTGSGAEFRIQLRDGSQVDVDLDGAVTLEDVLEAINNAGGGNVTAALAATGNSIVLEDLTTGGSSLRVTAVGGSTAFNDLGLNRSANVTGGSTLTGFAIDLSGDVGVGGRLSDAVEALVNTTDGVIQTRSDGFDQIIEALEKRIEAAEERLTQREGRLRRQFANLEQVMQSSQATLQRLTAALSGLGGGR
ncbi:MAG: flagellar filament capping protein FliD [Planctomycetota bacterium]